MHASFQRLKNFILRSPSTVYLKGDGYIPMYLPADKIQAKGEAWIEELLTAELPMLEQTIKQKGYASYFAMRDKGEAVLHLRIFRLLDVGGLTWECHYLD